MSDSKKSFWSGGVILLTVVSNVANSISSSYTIFSPSPSYADSIAFITVDFPALVYPTSATLGIPEAARFLRCVSRSPEIFSNSLRMVVRRCSSLRLSSSSFFSPAPLLLIAPLAPPCLDRASWSPTSRGSIYCNRATSTCSFASLVFARAEKISRISVVLSMTGQSKSLLRFRSCIGDNPLSNTTKSASSALTISRTSCTFPAPI